MHARRVAALLVLAAVVWGAVLAAAETPVPKPDPAAAAKRAQGRYLVQIMGCGDCHTPRSEEHTSELHSHYVISGARRALHSFPTRRSSDLTPVPKPDPAAAAKRAQGRYLVQIMGCGDCHTPGSFYGAPDPERALRDRK